MLFSKQHHQSFCYYLVYHIKHRFCLKILILSGKYSVLCCIHSCACDNVVYRFPSWGNFCREMTFVFLEPEWYFFYFHQTNGCFDCLFFFQEFWLRYLGCNYILSVCLIKCYKFRDLVIKLLYLTFYQFLKLMETLKCYLLWIS